MVGNLTSKKANDSMSSFSMLKAFDINIRPCKQLSTVEVLWSPPARGWIKCNTDGVASGSSLLDACGGLFRDEEANHLLSFSVFIGPRTPVVTEFMAVIIAVEKVKQLNWSKLWIETNCMLVVKAFANVHLVSWTLKSRWLTC
ncbi:uncharacterized protein LOC131643477 [Vicia villosa]|uniref:uncharacterized protein LOC131643477 n=1 Tax=Vicia villosa TaxID=3911 RepID=UPI00273A7ABB|nr:uncharacterized protein LOC131643477 [Vicia villosa]